jgi:hypothetical protein
MSLAEKFDEIAMSYASSQKFFILQDLQRAFYAGAEAWRDASESGELTADLNAEIDHFRSHK